MRYCIDTSGLTHGWRDYYPPDIFPALWKDIEGLIDSGGLISTEEVLKELEIGGDDLYQWALKRTHMFLPLDADIQIAVSSILAHPEHSKLIHPHSYSQTDADPFVIATAQVKGCAVISNEKLMLSPSPTKTKIPNVCQDLGIKHLSFLEFVRAEGWIYKR